MTTLSLPIDFGRRQCDRLLVRNLAKGDDRGSILWQALLIWQDYATAREDRRQVPADPVARAKCDAVAILEEFIGWTGGAGEFIESAINAGFFLLTPVNGQVCDLVLTDFFPANANFAKLSNSEVGGVGKSFSRVKRDAELAASDQLKLFEREGGLGGLDENKARAALRLINAICNSLKRQFPVDDTWKSVLIPKACEIIRQVPEADRECVFKWFIKNRSSQRIPLRLDFILDQFKDFIPDAVSAFRK